MPPNPRVFTDAEIIELGALAAVLNQVQISDYFEISQDTFQRICKRDDRVMRSYKKGKAKAIASVGSNLISQAKNGSTAAAAFFLKCQAGWSENKPVNEDPEVLVTFKRATGRSDYEES